MFKNAAVVVKKEDTATGNVSQPSNFNPFQEALNSMKVAKQDLPAVSRPPPQEKEVGDHHAQQMFAFFCLSI